MFGSDCESCPARGRCSEDLPLDRVFSYQLQMLMLHMLSELLVLFLERSEVDKAKNAAGQLWTPSKLMPKLMPPKLMPSMQLLLLC